MYFWVHSPEELAHNSRSGSGNSLEPAHRRGEPPHDLRQVATRGLNGRGGCGGSIGNRVHGPLSGVRHVLGGLQRGDHAVGKAIDVVIAIEQQVGRLAGVYQDVFGGRKQTLDAFDGVSGRGRTFSTSARTATLVSEICWLASTRS
jgi:hypothetical protein